MLTSTLVYGAGDLQKEYVSSWRSRLAGVDALQPATANLSTSGLWVSSRTFCYAVRSLRPRHVCHPDMAPGYTPFDRDTQQQEMEAIIAGDYKFEPGAFSLHAPQPNAPI